MHNHPIITESGSRTPIVDESIEQLVLAYAKEQGIKRREFCELEIQQSMTAVLANEGKRILEERVAERALNNT